MYCGTSLRLASCAHVLQIWLLARFLLIGMGGSTSGERTRKDGAVSTRPTAADDNKNDMSILSVPTTHTYTWTPYEFAITFA